MSAMNMNSCTKSMYSSELVNINFYLQDTGSLHVSNIFLLDTHTCNAPWHEWIVKYWQLWL